MNLDNPTVGLLGAGKMGSSMLNCWLQREETLLPHNVVIVDPFTNDNIVNFAKQGCIINPQQGFANCDYVIIAVKPQQMQDSINQIKFSLPNDVCIASIAAGVRLDSIKNILKAHQRLIRIMPNTPATIGMGAMAVYFSDYCTVEDISFTNKLMEACGKVVQIENEEHFDAVTAVSGSGPAYLYYFVECLEAAAQHAGLPQDIAQQLVRQTVLGAALMVDNDKSEPAKLRQDVSSPGGTTLAGLSVMQHQEKLMKLINDAVDQAKIRSEQLNSID